MKDNESFYHMISRLHALTNELAYLGKFITTKEQVEKVLRILPKSKQNIKVTVIREVKDLARMTLEELVGNLKIYEM